MKNNASIIAAVLLFLLSAALGLRIFTYRQSFDRAVARSQKSTEGYDEKLIRTVNQLEEKLTQQASFGYTGGKDPMTGRLRQVVKPVVVRTVDKKSSVDTKKEDPVRLTAIIFDDKKAKYTAIVMYNERSLSVEVGDRVGDRRINRITDKILYMESDKYSYRYDIFGKRDRKRKLKDLPDYFDTTF